MKKTIRKPENWQDFEYLCKKLWGEIWSISMKIKKNGRNGQPQAGVDVYGVPKGEFNYWGIQCKGKDEYANAKLTKSEINTEIEKAKTFKPQLDVFIFATSMNKDSEIEEYVRIKDLESRKNNGFEILLYCWEDIADLLEDNEDVLNTYLTGNNIKHKFDIELLFVNKEKEIEVNPKFLKKITKYKLMQKLEENLFLGSTYNQLFKKQLDIVNLAMPTLENQKVNRSWCKVKFVIKNCGSLVLEDWRVQLIFDNGILKLDDDFSTSYLLSTAVNIELQKNRTTYAYPEDKQIDYYPRSNEPLIQKDTAVITTYIIPKTDLKEIKVDWHLLARDFDKQGQLLIKVNPKYKEEIKWFEVESEQDLLEDEVEIVELKELKE